MKPSHMLHECMQDMTAINDVATLCEALSHHFGGSTISLNDRTMQAPHTCTPGNGSRWVSAPMWPQLVDTTPKTKSTPKTQDSDDPSADSKSESKFSSHTTAEDVANISNGKSETDKEKAGKVGALAQSFELGKCPFPTPIVCTISSHQSAAQLERCTLQLSEAVAVVFERTSTDTRLSNVTFKGVLSTVMTTVTVRSAFGLVFSFRLCSELKTFDICHFW